MTTKSVRHLEIDDTQDEFWEGFQHVRRDIRAGKTVDQALARAAVPVRKQDKTVDEVFSLDPTPNVHRSGAFMDGAKAARALYRAVLNPEDPALRTFTEYGLTAPERDAKIVAKNIANEVESVVRNVTSTQRRTS